MADQSLLDAVQEAQAPSNQDVLDAVHANQWANTFSNTPPVEVLRQRLNLADVVNRAVTARQNIAAQTDAKALDLMQRKARFEEYQRQAPLREQLLQARIDATGAAGRLQALKDTREAQHTENLSNGLIDLYSDPNFDPSSVEGKAHAAQLLVANPYAHHQFVGEVGKMITGKDNLSPEESIAEGRNLLDQTKDIPGARLSFSNGHYHIVQGTPQLTPEQAGAVTKAREDAKTAAALTRAQQFATIKEKEQAGKELDRQKTHLENLRMKPNVKDDPDVQRYLDTELQKVIAAKAAHVATPVVDETAPVVEDGVPPGDPSSHTPAGTPSAPPMLTSKEQFDSLPSGAHYVRDGIIYRKP